MGEKKQQVDLPGKQRTAARYKIVKYYRHFTQVVYKYTHGP